MEAVIKCCYGITQTFSWDSEEGHPGHIDFEDINCIFCNKNLRTVRCDLGSPELIKLDSTDYQLPAKMLRETNAEYAKRLKIIIDKYIDNPNNAA